MRENLMNLSTPLMIDGSLEEFSKAEDSSCEFSGSNACFWTERYQ